MENNLLFINCLWTKDYHKSLYAISLIEYDFKTEKIITNYEVLIKPNIYHKQASHLKTATLDKALGFKEAWSKIKTYFKNCIIVGYDLENNVLACLFDNLKRHNLNIASFRYIDIYELVLKYLNISELEDLSLGTILRYYGIYDPKLNLDQDYNIAVLRLFKALTKDYKVDILAWVHEVLTKQEELANNQQLSLSNLMKLYYLIKDLKANSELSELELSYLALWYEYNRTNEDGMKFASLIDEIIVEGKLSDIQYQSLIKVLERQIEAAKITKDTRALLSLQGFIKDILVNQEFDDIEILKLKIWLEENQSLKDSYPYDVIYDLINRLLLKRQFNYAERNDLYCLLDKYIYPLKYLKTKKARLGF